MLIAGCAHSPTYAPEDPLEPVNRAVYAFNNTADRWVLKPVAQAYVAAVPAEIRSTASRFLGNLLYPTTILNDLLQGKFAQAGRDTTRFLLNTSFGLGGLLDPATRIGWTENREDFGQTLAVWGVGDGWFLMLPFLGPSTNRDLVGRGIDVFAHPLYYAPPEVAIPLEAVDIVDTRAQLLGTEQVLAQQFDPYAFLRSAYLQRRRGLIYDGNPPPEEDDWGE
ncbi:MlaA family lipoprotein [Fontimonas thermophila]|nr:VacJ family lipoprotein [Fontimonas thermophila]